MNSVKPDTSSANSVFSAELPSSLENQDRRIQGSVLGLTPSGAPLIITEARAPSPSLESGYEQYPLTGRVAVRRSLDDEECKGPAIPYLEDEGSNSEAGFVKGLGTQWEAELAKMGFTNENRIGFRSQKGSVIEGFHLFRDVEDLPDGGCELILSLQMKILDLPQFLEIFEGVITLEQTSGMAYLTDHFDKIVLIWEILKGNSGVFDEFCVALSPEDIAEVDEFIKKSDAANTEPEVRFHPSPEPELTPSNFRHIELEAASGKEENYEWALPPTKEDDLLASEEDEKALLAAAIALSLQEN